MKLVRNYKVSLPIAGVVLAGLAWLAFGFFGIHTAFIDDKVNEAAPTFAVPAEQVVEAAPIEATPADAPDAAAAEANEAQPVEAAPAEEPAAEAAPAEAAPAEAPAETSPAETTPAETTPPETAAPAEPEIVTEATGTFAGASRYDVSGVANVLGNGTGQRFLRFEGFESSNGPDLNVYLFNPDDRDDYIDLGDLKGNIGDQNYEIPEGVDLERYSEVSIWCVRFGVGFGSANLATA